MKDIITRNIYMFTLEFVSRFVGGYVPHARAKSKIIRLKQVEDSSPGDSLALCLNAMIDIYNNENRYFDSTLKPKWNFQEFVNLVESSVYFNEEFDQLYDFVTSYLESESNHFHYVAQLELMDYFRACMYLPTMLLQIKRQKLKVGVHSNTKVNLFRNIKAVLPTVKLFCTIPDFAHQAHLLTNDRSVQNLLDQQNFMYFHSRWK